MGSQCLPERHPLQGLDQSKCSIKGINYHHILLYHFSHHLASKSVSNFRRSKSSPSTDTPKLALPLWLRHMARHISTAYRASLHSYITNWYSWRSKVISTQWKTSTGVIKTRFYTWSFTFTNREQRSPFHKSHVSKSPFPHPMATTVTTASSLHPPKKSVKSKGTSNMNPFSLVSPR